MRKKDEDTIITLYLRYGLKGILAVIANFLAKKNKWRKDGKEENN